MMGAGMRQVGVLCAAALYAVEHQRERLREDHLLAKRLAAKLSDVPGLAVHPVDTNIVLVDLTDRSAAEFVQRLRTLDVLVNAVLPTRLRAVVHRDLEAAHIDAALGAFARA
jgi:threonine aldolase